MNTLTYAKQYAVFYEKLSADDGIEHYCKVFDKNVYFEDPFHQCRGVDELYHVFEKMYETLHMPRFTINEIICNEQTAYIRWVFDYQRTPIAPVEKFTGVSRVQFLHNGKVISHVDYWDAAQHVYEKVPLLGSILSMIKKKIAS
jgi:hypothetical protein